jgi:eukaryotic-like serine/threonine-protein kinase
MTRDKVSNEALYILRSLQENARTGRSNKLADVKVSLESNVSIEFDSYFFFLRKFHYIAMDREALLKLTDQGQRSRVTTSTSSPARWASSSRIKSSSTSRPIR